MKMYMFKAVSIAIATSAITFSGAQTFGNTISYSEVVYWNQNFLFGTKVEIPQSMTLQSFGLMYSLPGGRPLVCNGIFGVYSSNSSGRPGSRIATTNSVHLDSVATYDNIQFTSSPTIAAGTYWMMGLFDSLCSLRTGFYPLSGSPYVSAEFIGGMPNTFSGSTVVFGYKYNFWINGAVPEPSTLLSLLLGALALKRCRKPNVDSLREPQEIEH